jgi:hypothetical protein
MPMYLVTSGSFFEHVIAWLAPVVRLLYGIEPPPPVQTSFEQAIAEALMLRKYLCFVAVLLLAYVMYEISCMITYLLDDVLTRAREHLNEIWIQYGPSFMIVCPNVAVAT